MKKVLKFILYIFICGAIYFLLIEFILRISLFSQYLNIDLLRQPWLYAGYSSDDDYWKLYYRLGGEFRPPNPKAIHPLLGWSQVYITKANPLGLQTETLELMYSEKKKILFYGDSFVRGIGALEYEIPRYMTDHFKDVAVIDLSCGGYGLDQMFLMFKLTHKKVIKPYIVFGILVEDDLDRSILSVRTGQKPYFIANNEKLILKNVPINSDHQHYFDTHPVRIKSYLFRLILRGFSKNIPLLKRHLEKVDEKTKINTKIIDEIYAICKQENYPLLFVLFHTNLQSVSWQEKFLKDKFQQLQIPYIDTVDFLKEYADQYNLALLDFYVLGGIGRGHHNDLGNKIISEGFLKYLSQAYNFKLDSDNL